MQIEKHYEGGLKNPYDGKDDAPATSARKITLAVLHELSDRRGISGEMEQIDDEVREELVQSLTDIVQHGLDRHLTTTAGELSTTALVARLHANAKVYATATDRHGLTMEDRVHGAVYKTLTLLESQMQVHHHPLPFPFNTDLADDYADYRDAEPSAQGRRLTQLDRDLFD